MKKRSIRRVGTVLAIVIGALAARLSMATGGANDWHAYRNRSTGLSFRYPANLRIQERDLSVGGGWPPDLVEITDLIGDTPSNPGSIVLSFTVNSGPHPESSEAKELASAKTRHLNEAAAIRTGVQQYSAVMRLDSHDALMGVHCGSAACHWRVTIVEPRQCTIQSGLAGADLDESDPPLHDGRFPLRSIIETVHFDAPPS